MENKKKLIKEFVRYVFVGGIAALIDMGVNFSMLRFILGASKDDTWAVIISVALGFIFGTIANFTLSNIFVFKGAEQQKRGKTVKGFILSTIVGLIGFGLTEGLTVLGTNLIADTGFWYLFLTCCVKGIVLVWNYVGRRVFVYGKDKESATSEGGAEGNRQ